IEYPDYEQLEFVVYQLSKAYENVGNQAEVLNVLNELVSRWPKSEYIQEAQFRRGEILFIQQDYAGAEQAYQVVLDNGSGSRFYEQSLYKHGWSCFKQGFYPPGIESFLTLMDRKLGMLEEVDVATKVDSLSRADRELFDDTMRVMSLVFSYEDGADSIRSYVEEHQSSNYVYLLYQSLADLYLEKERYSDAAGVFQAYAADYPEHFEAPVFQAQSIEAYKDGGFPSLVFESKKQYVSIYGLTADYWNSWVPEQRPEVVAELRVSLSDLAQYDHFRAQQDKDPEAYAAAAEWYQKYLDYFPNDPDAAERTFLLAEALMESAQPLEAMQAYQKVAYNYQEFPEAADAGFAAILASRAYGQTLSSEAAVAWDAQQIMEDLKFANAYPDEMKSSSVFISVAEQLFENQRFTAASIVAGELLTREPAAADEFQKVAWRVVSHARFDQASYVYAEQAYRELAQQDISSSEQDEVQQRIAASIFRQAEADQLAGNIDAAVANYLRIDGSSDIKAKAVFDAATLLIVNERWSDSIPVLQQFRSIYPDHSLNNDVSQKIAYSYLQAGMLLAAASEFEQLAVNDALSPEIRRESLWQAAELYQAQNELAAAKRNYRQFVTEFPQPMSESLEARYRLSELATEMQEPQARVVVLKEIIKQDAEAGEERSDRSQYLAAKATLELAHPYWETFAAAKLTAPLKNSMKLKKARMEDALGAYNKAASYGVAEVTTVATYQVAEIYYQLSKDLMASDKPDDLNEEELEQYEILLEEQAFPFEEKAIELYEVNVPRAANGLYDQAVKDSYRRLAELMPGTYAKSERSENYALLSD
ncbi:MAG: tetratricopeptide repeat protein, partial [Gammaproteobacteria bacterium]|nr:tetratricopeptide repeat protein [Gammaproteobacteria bacterium]